MNESEFNRLADAALARIETAIDNCGGDAECNRSGNVLEIEFVDNGSKIIINSQAPMQQMWVAAKSGGFHYKRDDARWINTRDGSELSAALSRMVGEQGGVGVALDGF